MQQNELKQSNTSVVLCLLVFLFLIIAGVQVEAGQNYYTDATTFYWSADYGDEGNGVVEDEGNIYWCGRGYLASTSTYKYENLGWYITLTSSNTGQSVTLYIEQNENCLVHQEDVDGYRYQLYVVTRDELSDAVEDKGYNLTNFFKTTVEAEFNGNVRLYNANTDITLTNGGPYNLTSGSNLTNLLYYMSYYSYTTSSQTTVKNQLVGKTLIITGSNIVTYYTFTYEANGGSVSPTSYTGAEGTTTTLPTPTRTGYTFAGWECDQTGTWFSTNGNISTRTLTKNYDFTAQWEANDVTFTYDANGGSVSPTIQTGTYGETVIMPTPTRTGYAFVGWECDQTGTWFSTNGKTSTRTLTKDYSFTAQWEVIQYTITLDPNGGTSASTISVTKNYGVGIYVYWSYTPTRDGHTFVGWSEDADSTTAEYVRGGTYIINEDDTWYAVWKAETYTVSYNANTTDIVGNIPSNQTKTYGVILTISSLVPTRDGYTFIEWLDEENGWSYSPGGTTNYNGTRTLYAQWDKIPELTVSDVYMYLDSEFDEERFYKDIQALDDEDGDISSQVIFNKDEIIELLESLKGENIEGNMIYELDVLYSVQDSAGNQVEKSAILYVYAMYETIESTTSIVGNTGYVRFISEDYIDTLEENSVWRQSDNWNYLLSVLKNAEN